MKKEKLTKDELKLLKGGIGKKMSSFSEMSDNQQPGIGCDLFGGSCKSGCRTGCLSACKSGNKNGLKK